MMTHISNTGASKRTSTQAQNIGITPAATPRTLSEHFFAIRQEDIDRQLAEPVDEERLSAWHKPQVEGLGDQNQQQALMLHTVLLLSYQLQQMGQLALDKYLHLPAEAAHKIASDFIEVALDREPLKGVGELLTRIKAREGRADKLGWVNGDGPADYEKASDEYTKLVHSLLEAVRTTIFRRYRLTSLLALYESGSIKYDLLYSKGKERLRQKLPSSAPVDSPTTGWSGNRCIVLEQALRQFNLGLAKSLALDYSI